MDFPGFRAGRACGKYPGGWLEWPSRFGTLGMHYSERPRLADERLRSTRRSTSPSGGSSPAGRPAGCPVGLLAASRAGLVAGRRTTHRGVQPRSGPACRRAVPRGELGRRAGRRPVERRRSYRDIRCQWVRGGPCPRCQHRPAGRATFDRTPHLPLVRPG